MLIDLPKVIQDVLEGDNFSPQAREYDHLVENILDPISRDVAERYFTIESTPVWVENETEEEEAADYKSLLTPSGVARLVGCLREGWHTEYILITPYSDRRPALIELIRTDESTTLREIRLF